MIDLKKTVYTILQWDTELSTLPGGIHTWEDWKNVREDYSPIFPQVTYQLISSGNIQSIGVRTETVQVSSWAATQAEAFLYFKKIVALFDNTGPVQDYNACRWTGRAESYDPDTKSFWIHADFAFIIHDRTL